VARKSVIDHQESPLTVFTDRVYELASIGSRESQRL
jgi:hypothetical protein